MWPGHILHCDLVLFPNAQLFCELQWTTNLNWSQLFWTYVKMLTKKCEPSQPDKNWGFVTFSVTLVKFWIQCYWNTLRVGDTFVETFKLWSWLKFYHHFDCHNYIRVCLNAFLCDKIFVISWQCCSFEEFWYLFMLTANTNGWLCFLYFSMSCVPLICALDSICPG